MQITQDLVNAIIDGKAAESLYQEFKRGAALSRHSTDRNELVKDLTGFANADGGVIFYGIAEEEIDGVVCASHIDPVTDEKANANWIADVVRGASAPPLTRYHITELAQPQGGKVIAIEVEASSSAHQSLGDNKYYQRTARSTVPMVDHQIRDVMGRRTKPLADVRIDTQIVTRTGDLHRDSLVIGI